MMFWYGPGMGGWGYGLVSVILFWVVVILGIVALVRYLGRAERRTPTPPAGRSSAEQLLAERFARGEIDEQEYRRRLDTLRTGGN